MSENTICTTFVNQIKFLQEMNQQAAQELVYFHVPNGGSRKSSFEGYNLKKMGLLPGVADYIFMWRINSLTKVGFIEFKTKKGKQTDTQKEFEKRSNALHIPYELARSEKEGIDILIKWGIFK
tara:strand:+ start:169 stop:537 length:369 start_codon:yes stop_codon:yes gene_type:complete